MAVAPKTTCQNYCSLYCKRYKGTGFFSMKLKGTKFQLAVWRYLVKIPPGKVKTYKEIAIYLKKSPFADPISNLSNASKISLLKFFIIKDLPISSVIKR